MINKEAKQLIKGLELVTELRKKAMNSSGITEEDLLKFAEVTDAYLFEYGLINPRSEDKKKVREMLLRGFKDKTGRINPLLPEKTVMRKIQDRRIARGVSSVTDLLREGNFAETQNRLIFVINFLQKIEQILADPRYFIISA